MTDIIERLAQVRGDNEDAREAINEINDLRDIRASLNADLLAAEAEIERLRAALRAVADYTPGGDHQSVLETVRRALEPKP